MGTRPVENYYFSSFVGLRRAARLRLAGGRSNGIAGRSSRTVDSLTDQSDAGRPRRGRGADAAVMRFSNAHALLNVTLEVPRVETRVPDRFVDAAKLAYRELRGAELRGEGRVLKLRPGPLDGVPHDSFMVEREANPTVLYLLHRGQGRGRGIPAAAQHWLAGRHRSPSRRR